MAVRRKIGPEKDKRIYERRRKRVQTDHRAQVGSGTATAEVAIKTQRNTKTLFMTLIFLDGGARCSLTEYSSTIYWCLQRWLPSDMYSGNLGRATNAAGHGATVSCMEERILVQDDEEAILEIMCSILTASGYKCLKATSPKKAWAILKSGKGVAVVICGFFESSEDGFFERTIKTFPDVPIVVASACHNSSIIAGVLREGAFDWLLIPFEREQLLVVVRRALEYRRLKLENRALRAKLAKLAQS
jgi:CheY-like chemotaxis protein